VNSEGLYLLGVVFCGIIVGEPWDDTYRRGSIQEGAALSLFVFMTAATRIHGRRRLLYFSFDITQVLI
jgi:hypothetical protein